VENKNYKFKTPVFSTEKYRGFKFTHFNRKFLADVLVWKKYQSQNELFNNQSQKSNHHEKIVTAGISVYWHFIGSHSAVTRLNICTQRLRRQMGAFLHSGWLCIYRLQTKRQACSIRITCH